MKYFFNSEVQKDNVNIKPIVFGNETKKIYIISFIETSFNIIKLQNITNNTSSQHPTIFNKKYNIYLVYQKINTSNSKNTILF